MEIQCRPHFVYLGQKRGDFTVFPRFLSALVVSAPIWANPSAPVTFYQDVLPVLQKHCQSCHRPGEAAPVSFLTYKTTRPWAKAIKQAVQTRKMPPWFADPHTGQFANDRSLPPADLALLVRWADTGALAGDPKSAPAPLQFAEGWQMGKPDKIYEMPVEYTIPASGTLEYTYFVIPSGFTEDRWVQASEARPGNRSVVHHMIAFVRAPGSTWLSDAKSGIPFIPKDERGSGGEGKDGMADEWLAGYAPGTPPMQLQPGQARLVPAGSDIVLQVHYTANGKAQNDRSRLGLRFATAPVKERVTIAAASTSKFVIPPGAPDYEVRATTTLAAPVKLVNLQPHMHLRGKSFTYRLIYPDGRTRDLLNVPRYDFNWQLVYEPSGDLRLPAGTQMECVATYDNSANNPFNPDPKSEVRWGDQSWQEMMIGFFDIAIDPKMDRRELYPRRQSKRNPGD